MLRKISFASIPALALVAMAAALSVKAAEQLSEADLKRYGQQLSQECLGCHRLDGTDVGVPAIVDLSKAEFMKAMQLYRTGLRANPIMVSVASTLEDQQIEALALYFSSLKGAKKPEGGAPTTAAPSEPKSTAAPRGTKTGR